MCRNTVGQYDTLIENRLTYSFEKELEIPMTPGAYEVGISADYTEGGMIFLNIFGHDIMLNTSKNTVSVGQSSCPISFNKKTLDIRIIVDKYSFEIFTDGGKFFFTACPDMDENFTHMVLRSDIQLKNATISVATLKDLEGQK